MRYRIPLIDLRETFPLGEPVREKPAARPKPNTDVPSKRHVGIWGFASFIVTAAFVTFLLAIAILVIDLFGPLAGGAIVLVAIGKLNIRT